MTNGTLTAPAPIELDEDDFVITEFNLPHLGDNLEEAAEEERERYDEQILAALVCV